MRSKWIRKIKQLCCLLLIACCLAVMWSQSAYAAAGEYGTTQASISFIKKDGSKTVETEDIGVLSGVSDSIVSATIKLLQEPEYIKFEYTYQGKTMVVEKGSPKTGDGIISVPDTSTIKPDMVLSTLKADGDWETLFDATWKDSAAISNSINEKVIQAVEALMGWIADQVGATFNDIILDFGTKFGPDITYFNKLIGENIVPVIQVAFKTIGWSFMFLIFLLVVFLTLFGMFTGFEEGLGPLVGRLFISGFLVVEAYQITNYLLNVGDYFISGLQSLSTKVDASALASLIQNSKVNMILAIIFSIMVLWNIFKLLAEIIGRYIVVSIMYYTSPVAYATFVSKATGSVFTNYMKMLFSMMFVMLMNVFFLNIIATIIGNAANFNKAAATAMDSIIFYFSLLAVIKVAQEIDDYMNSIGLSVGRSASKLAGSAIGAMMGIRTAAGAARGISHLAGKVSGGYQKLSGSGAGSSGNRRAGTKIGKDMDKSQNGSINKSPRRAYSTAQIAKSGASLSGKAMNDTLKKAGVKLPKGTVLQNGSRLTGDGKGGLKGTMVTKNPNGTESVMEISSEPRKGFSKIADAVGDNPALYGRLEPDSPPIGGTGFVESENGHKEIRSLSASTGNFTKDQMQALGFDVSRYDDMYVRPLQGGDSFGIYNENDRRVGVVDFSGNGVSNIATESGNKMSAYLSPGFVQDKEIISDGAVIDNFGEPIENCTQNKMEEEGYLKATFEDGKTYAFKDPSVYEAGRNDRIVTLRNGTTYYVEQIKNNERPGNKRLVS